MKKKSELFSVFNKKGQIVVFRDEGIRYIPIFMDEITAKLAALKRKYETVRKVKVVVL